MDRRASQYKYMLKNNLDKHRLAFSGSSDKYIQMMLWAKYMAKCTQLFKPAIRNAGFLCKHLLGYLKSISQRA